MRLKQVKLSGFKSFTDETDFVFKENGITMIVGPNGCGKSNVVDAIRWALGEQSPRLMRSSAMADVIFAGSSSRKPVGRAEVTLLFDNADHTALEQYSAYDEIAVTRRLYRSGESEYLINKLPSRLLDVRELVMDTGAAGRSYSIVEQGRVEEFITASPADRRAYMEEAAGIVRYKTKRIAAEKKLEQTRQNLLRVEDVLGELTRQEASLREQMEAAREYLALQEEARLLSGDLARLRHDGAARRCRELEDTLAALRNEDTAVQQTLARLGSRIHESDLEQTRRETGLREAREAVHGKESELHRDETQLALERQNRDNIRDWLDEHTRTRDDLRQRAETLVAQQDEARGELEAQRAEAEALRADIEREEADHAERRREAEARAARVKALQEQALESHTTLHGLANQQALLRERTADAERRLEGLAEQAGTAGQELERLHEAQARRRTRADEVAREREAAEQAVRDLNERIAADEAALESARSRETDLQREVMATRSRLETLTEIEAQHEGFGETVRTFLDWLGAHPAEREALGVLGPLAELITVPGEVVDWAGDYLAPYLEVIVVREAAALPALAGHLEALGLGGLRVVALDSLPANGNGNSADPGHAPGRADAHDAERLAPLLGFGEEVQALGGALFGATRLLSPAAPLHPLPAPLGPEAEWVSRDGAVHIDHKAQITLGRGAAPAVGILQRRAEIGELQQRLDAGEQRLEQARADAGAAADALQARREELRERESARSALVLSGREVEQELAAGERERERLEQVLAGHRRESARLEEELAQFAGQAETLRADEARWEETRQRLDAELSAARGEDERAQAALGELSERLTQRKVALSRADSRLDALGQRLADMGREAGEVAGRLQETDEGLERQRARLDETAAAIGRLEAALAAHREALDALEGDVRQRREAYEAQEAHRRTLSDQIRAERRRHEMNQSRTHEVELALTAERMRLEQFSEQLADLPARTDDAEVADEKTLENRLAAAQARLRRMEGVNLGAPQEYEALTERLAFLRSQQGDLMEAIDDLEASIRRMNAESRKRFRETFDQVNEKFQVLFPQVFGGGEARLVMTDADDPLATGVDIIAQPPGKKLQGLSLLSGGEKALTAISLIFAFFLHKPSPFCLLDEVDAPLDDVNVTRFNRLIGSMTEHSQFIIITHNKRTMEVGDYLYGVTMEEPGVSRIVSVNLAGQS